MNGHTPGPWFAEGPERSGIYVTLGSQQFKDACALFGHPIDEVRANANLISAAPCLLSAISGLLPHVLRADPAVASQARAAIAKATGEHP